MLPVRCFTCNKVLGQYQFALDAFQKKYEHAEHAEHSEHADSKPYPEFFQELKITRYCCRKIFLTHVDIYSYDDEAKMDHVEVRKDLEVEKIVIAD